MNTKITALTLAAASAFAFAPKPAVANDHTAGAVIAGAVIGGLLGAAVANSNDCGPTPVYTNVGYCPPPAPVYVADGYWTTAPVNVWVAPVWVVERDYYGRSCRRYVAGHYEYRNERRWVAHNAPVYRGHEVARGYGNNYNGNHGYNNGSNHSYNNGRNNGHDNGRYNDRDNRHDRR